MANLKDENVRKLCHEHVPPIMTLCENCKNWCTFRDGLKATNFRFRKVPHV